MMNQELIAKAAEIVKENSVYGGKAGFGFCTLSLIDSDGYPSASVLTPSRSDGIHWLTFGTMLDQNRAQRALNCSHASVCFSAAEYCINLVGDIEVITADDVKQAMWYDGLSHHFTGPDDPNYCVLKFTAKRYSLFLDYQDVAGSL